MARDDIAHQVRQVAEAMMADDGDFTAEVGQTIFEIAQEHNPWAAHCEAGHMFEDYPCDEFERGLSLALSWLRSKAGIASTEPAPSGD